MIDEFGVDSIEKASDSLASAYIWGKFLDNIGAWILVLAIIVISVVFFFFKIKDYLSDRKWTKLLDREIAVLEKRSREKD